MPNEEGVVEACRALGNLSRLATPALLADAASSCTCSAASRPFAASSSLAFLAFSAVARSAARSWAPALALTS